MATNRGREMDEAAPSMGTLRKAHYSMFLHQLSKPALARRIISGEACQPSARHATTFAELNPYRWQMLGPGLGPGR
eukprot:1154576-Pelagomonas_calceolata.AAC.5